MDMQYFAVGIALVLATMLVLILYLRLIQLDQRAKVSQHRSKDESFADLLNYAAVVDDGIIVNKNGSFMAAYIYRGDDNGSSTNAQREWVAEAINRAMVPLGSGWMCHVDCVRDETSNYIAPQLSKFPDPISAAIDQERRRTFEARGSVYDSHFVITLTFFPPLLSKQKFVELMFDDETDKVTKATRTRSLIRDFKNSLSNFESRLSSALYLERLGQIDELNEDGTSTAYDQFLHHLQLCISGESHPVVLPKTPAYLDNYIGGKELYSGVIPKLGDKYIQVVSIEGFPPESTPGMLTILGELQLSYRWSTRFIFMEPYEALNHLDKFRKKWRQKVRGFFDQVFGTGNGPIDQHALAMVEDAEAAMAEVNSGHVSYGYYTSLVVLMSEDREQLEQSSLYIEKRIQQLGFVARIETVNTLDAFMGSLPGHGEENVRRPLIHTLNFADLIPVSSIWTGLDYAPCPLYAPGLPPLMHCLTDGNTPFRLNLHVRDLGHTAIFGPTRTGKTTLVSLIYAQLMRYEGMSLYGFDKGLGLFPVTKACGGDHYTIAGEGSGLSFCPLQYLDSTNDRAWATDWIETMLKLNGIEIKPEQRNEIAAAIKSMHADGSKTLTDFVSVVQDIEIRQALQQYTLEGSMGHLLDASEDSLELSRITTFEIEELMDLDEKYALPVLLYLFRRIEKSLHGQPAAIVLEEAWLMLGHPAFSARVRSWLKSFAKKNCALILVTQNISDAANSGILDVITESTATKIFLPNVNAREEMASNLYTRMGLNNRQIELISTAIPKRQYYFVSAEGARLFELALGPLQLAFVGAGDLDSIAQMRRLEKVHGSSWPEQWLMQKQIALTDYIGLDDNNAETDEGELAA